MKMPKKYQWKDGSLPLQLDINAGSIEAILFGGDEHLYEDQSEGEINITVDAIDPAKAL